MMNWFTSRIKRSWRWWWRHPKKIAIPVTIAVILFIAIGGYLFARFYNYTQDDPRFCQSCHIMEEAWDKWAISEHKDVGCHKCHEQSVLGGARQILDFAFGNFTRVEKHATVQDEFCKQCHESNNPKWVQVAATAGHRVHSEEQNVACTKCHSVSLHRFEPPAPICNVCHAEQEVEVSGMADMHCQTCHQFLAEDASLVPTRKACLDCHQSLTTVAVNWPADAPMQFPCSDCHQPHEQAKPVVECQSCHSVSGLHQAGAHVASQCQTCHQPHSWQVAPRDTCLTCHTSQTDHYPDNACSLCHSFPGE
ncbi:MAG: hypothetical protein HY662_05370 [Chloroflexi bacterium]|nr:hypothetical protein [Chloroflexota bacterium]